MARSRRVQHAQIISVIGASDTSGGFRAKTLQKFPCVRKLRLDRPIKIEPQDNLTFAGFPRKSFRTRSSQFVIDKMWCEPKLRLRLERGRGRERCNMELFLEQQIPPRRSRRCIRVRRQPHPIPAARRRTACDSPVFKLFRVIVGPDQLLPQFLISSVTPKKLPSPL